MLFEAISVIPEVFEPYVGASILGRARKKGVFDFRAYDLRCWTHDRHRTVDDAPFGGGQGMLMKPQPIFEAVRAVSAAHEKKPYTIFFSPCGETFTEAAAQELSEQDSILFVCGRYEGMDERCYTLADKVLSIGDYVLTGGELASLVVMDAVVRLLPGALGDEKSAQDESFSDGLLEYAQYTRPASFEDMDVPEVLLSGDHGKVRAWRRESSLLRTAAWRPDLLEGADLTSEEQRIVESFRSREERDGSTSC